MGSQRVRLDWTTNNTQHGTPTLLAHCCVFPLYHLKLPCTSYSPISFFFFCCCFFFFLQKSILKYTVGSKTALHSSYRRQQISWQGIQVCLNRNGTKGHHCLRYKGTAYFLPDFLIPPVAKGPFPAAFAFSSSSFFCSSFCLNALSRPSPWLASWAASGASSCHLRGPTWRLPPLPQTLPPEAYSPISWTHIPAYHFICRHFSIHL